MPSLEQIEELYTAHDELLYNDVRKGDRNLASEDSFKRLFRWQYTEYTRLLGKCVHISTHGIDNELKYASSLLRQAEGLARGSFDVRLATARAEMALQYIHKWLQRMRCSLIQESE